MARTRLDLECPLDEVGGLMPHKTNKRGTFTVDIVLPEIGRLKRASGTKDPKEFKAILAMLSTLVEWRSLDTLRRIQAKSLHLLDALALHRRKELDKIQTEEASLPVRPAWEEWLATSDYSAKVRQDIGYTLSALTRKDPEGRKEPRISELPDRLESLLKEKSQAPRMCRKMKAHVQAFLKSTLGKHHDVYLKVSELKTRKLKRKRKPPLLTPADVRRLVTNLRVGGPDVWTMCVTGMLPNREYHLDWVVSGRTVHIPGEKTESRDRVIPLFGTVTRPSVHPRTLADHVRQASNGTVQAKDFRNIFARWCFDAGIPEYRIEQYMGHSTRSMTRDYARGVTKATMRQDVAKFRAYVGAEPTYSARRDRN